MKKVLIINGSPKKEGNTTALIGWFVEGLRPYDVSVDLVHVASLHFKAVGCTSCRACQKMKSYGCVIEDEMRPILAAMLQADVIVMASPLYFFSVSAQLKTVIDRTFSLYKWDNAVGAMETPLKGKMLVLLGSAFEHEGLKAFEEPLAMTAAYTSMKYLSLIVPDAGVSGEIVAKKGAKEQAIAFAEKVWTSL